MFYFYSHVLDLGKQKAMVFAIRNFRCPVYHTTAGLGWAGLGLGCAGWAGGLRCEPSFVVPIP